MVEVLKISYMALITIQTAGSVEDPPRKKYKQQDLGPLLLNATKVDLDDTVADFLYGTGTPLHISRWNSPLAYV